jgi:hypothetical protein
LALSPDGNSLAGLSSAGRREVEVWSFRSGELSARIPIEGYPSSIDFVGPGRVVVEISDSPTSFGLFEVAGGRRVLTIRSPIAIEHKSLAPSPDGKSLAMAALSRNSAGVYSLVTGRLTGDWAIPTVEGGESLNCRGMTFSPDGAELAGLFLGYRSARIMAWGASGSVVADVVLPAGTSGELARQTSYIGPALEWLPDRTGWLMYGAVLVDRGGKNHVSLSPEGLAPSFRTLPRRLLDGERLLMVDGTPLAPVLRTVPLP